jgi:hypothetical protein
MAQPNASKPTRLEFIRSPLSGHCEIYDFFALALEGLRFRRRGSGWHFGQK